MRSAIQQLLDRCNSEPPVLLDDEIASWPADLRDALIERNALVAALPLDSLACDGCGGENVGEIVRLERSGAEGLLTYLVCPACGPTQVASQRLRRWRIDFPSLIRSVFGSVLPDREPVELVPKRLWRVGLWNSHAVFFGRLLYRRDGRDVLRAWRVPPRAVVFLSQGRLGGTSESTDPAIQSLEHVLQWRRGKFHLDWEVVEAQLEAASGADSSRAKPARKRANRAADIEALKSELQEHLRAARQHALATFDQTGTPELLPRPTQTELARRVGRSQYTVSRCLADKTAVELRFLWDLALDLDRILRRSN